MTSSPLVLLWLPIGILPWAINGFLAIRVIEGQEKVLAPGERWTLGFLWGCTGTLALTLLAHILFGLPFTFTGFTVVQVILFTVLLVLHFLRTGVRRETLLERAWNHLPAFPLRWEAPTERTSRILWTVLCVLLLWSAVKIAAGTFMLVTAPTSLDDSISNWNIRGKVYFETKELTLVLPSQKPGDPPSEISSYPPTVPLTKTWLSALAGGWHEPLINSIHLLWYLTSVFLTFFILRRLTSRFWAFVGVYMLISAPLYLIQGTNAYADVFLSAHVLSAIGPLVVAFHAKKRSEALAWLRLSAFGIALLPFTKNEGLMIYLPISLLLAFCVFGLLGRKRILVLADIRELLLWFAGLLLFCVPWIAFKMLHGLGFANAKHLSAFGLSWQPGVPTALWVTTFFEANWLLLIPLFFLLLITRCRKAFTPPLLLLSLSILLILSGQTFLYLFTGLSTEALYQTGYARGIAHLLPLMCILTTLLAEDAMKKTDG